MEEKKEKKKFFVAVKDEFRKIRSLGFKQGIVYIWDYYKLYLFVIVLLVSMVIFFTDGENIRDQILHCTVSAELYYNIYDYLEAFDDTMGLDPATEYAYIEPMTRLGFYTDEMHSLWIATNQLDFILMDKGKFDNSLNLDSFYELDEFLPPELLEELEDRLVLFEKPEYGIHAYYGVELTDYFDLSFDEDGTYDDGIFACIPNTSQYPEYAVMFLRYLVEHPQKDFVPPQ